MRKNLRLVNVGADVVENMRDAQFELVSQVVVQWIAIHSNDISLRRNVKGAQFRGKHSGRGRKMDV